MTNPTSTASACSWVEITQVIMTAAERPDSVPADTRATDLILRVRGFLAQDATVGEEVGITTLAGRELRGTLSDIHPRHRHDFGEPVAELLRVGVEVREELRALRSAEQGGDA